MTKRYNYGGQAVIDGVMMRGRRAMVTAVRKPDGDIAVDVQRLPGISTSRARRIPVIRGVVVLVETMVLGMKSLIYSANMSYAEEEDAEPVSGAAAGGMVAVSVAFAVGLFFLAPLFITRSIDAYIESSILFHLVEGLVRLGLFIAYLRIINFSSGVSKVFAYHGAEHKSVNAYEHGVPLDVDSVRRHSTAHTRCGTGFIFIVLVIAIVVFALIGRPSIGMMVLWRVILIPAISGIGYEATQFAARHTDNRFIRAFLSPGLWLQGLTTREPDDHQIEVALVALRRAVEIDENEAGPAPAAPSPD